MTDDPSNDRHEALFLAALEQPPAQRTIWLLQQCGNDIQLFEAVSALLGSDRLNDDGLLESLSTASFSEQIPLRIGGYRVTRLLGSGGSGLVFDATHDQTSRRAAVKLIRSGFNTTRQRIRFQIEAETLAKLNHPGIAQLFDAGVADVQYAESSVTARPFIAMEFVDGVSIVEHLRSSPQSVRRRVELMLEIARAVSHAHQRGVIHRDLKPANLLISHVNGQAKVVDFGIAKLLAGATAVTTEGMAIGTPSFMSPEQLAGDVARIDVTTDVYGLGAVTYALLAGRAPVEASGLLTPTLAVRLLAAEPPSLRSLAPEIDRDLAAVVHKALEREPEARYRNAEAFSTDLERWLSKRPTQARPVGIIGRTVKTVRRRPGAVAAVGIISFSLAAMAAIAVWQGIAARRAVERERGALSDQRAAIDYLSDLLLRASPSSRRNVGPNYRLSDLIDDANAEIGALADRPAVQATVRITLGKIFLAMGRHGEAEGNLRFALALKNLPEPEVDQAKETLARSLIERNEWSAARELRRQVYDWRMANLGKDDANTLAARADLVLANLTLNDAGPQPPFSELLKEMEAVKARRGDTWTIDDDFCQLRVRELAVRLMVDQGVDPILGQRILDDTEKQARQLLPKNHPTILRLNRSRTIALYREGDSKGALVVAREVRAALGERLEEGHFDVVNQDALIAAILGDLEIYPDAYDLMQSVEQRFSKILGPQNLRTIQTRQSMALHLQKMGRLDEADQLFQKCVIDYEKAGGPNEYFLRATRMRLARLRFMQQKYQEAVEIYKQHIPPVADDGQPINPEIADWYGAYAEALWHAGDKARAQQYAKLVVASMLKSFGEDSAQTRDAKELQERLR